MKKILYKSSMPTAKEWKELRSYVKWTIYEDDIFQIASKNTLYAISVYDSDKIIGMGRVIGDGIICFYIQDVVVHPMYQSQGIGKKIVLQLMKWIKEHSKNNSVIGLMASKGCEKFYEKLGFVQRPNSKMGAGMVYLNKKY